MPRVCDIKLNPEVAHDLAKSVFPLGVEMIELVHHYWRIRLSRDGDGSAT